MNESPKGATEERDGEADLEIPDWMVPGTVSHRPTGRCNVLLVAPHGYPGDDNNTELLGALLAEELDCLAVVNYGKYRKPLSKSEGEPEKEDPGECIADLNKPSHAEKCESDYYLPLMNSIGCIKKESKAPAIVIFLHGMADENADKHKADMVIGKGFVGEYDPGEATGSAGLFTGLQEGLSKLGTVRDDLKQYSASASMTAHLRKKLGKDVEAVQIEFKHEGFRDTQKNIAETARKVGHVVKNLEAFSEWKETMSIPATKSMDAANEPKEGEMPDSRSSEQDLAKNDEVNAELVKEAVQFINEKANETLYRGSEEIGAYILKHFFDDDIKKATSRNPRKPNNYKALCNHEELVVTPERLSVMVRVAAQERLFKEKKVNTEKLSYSHKAELVKLDKDKTRLELAQETIKKKLSVRQLSERVREVRGEELSGKEPSLLLLESKITDPVRLFETSRLSPLIKDEAKRKEQLKRMRKKRRQALMEKVDDALQRMEQWQEHYKSLKSDLEEIDREGRGQADEQ